MILTIDRECGSGGHVIAERLSSVYSLPLYDKEILSKRAVETGMGEEMKLFFDERPMENLFYTISRSGETPVFGKKTYERFQSLIGETDFILIGRCGNYIYSREKSLVSIFLHAELSDRIRRTMKKQDIDRFAAGKLVDEVDDKRRRFHKYYTGKEWGKAADYDISLNTSFIGLDGAVSLLTQYINAKMNSREI